MHKFKRVLAFLGIILLIALPITLIISASTASKDSPSFFVASIFLIVLVPIILYGYILIYKLVHKNKDENLNLLNSDSDEPSSKDNN